MGGSRSSSNRSSSLAHIALALQAFYLNLIIDQANGSEYLDIRPLGPALPYPPAPAPYWGGEGGRSGAGGYEGYSGAFQGNRDTGGFRANNGFHDDLLSQRNAYDVGKTFGGGYDYGKSAVQGGGYKDLNGRNRGHQAAGFATSYRKDESGDKSTYYDDGLGHVGKLNYGAYDNRFRDTGGAARRGGYHDSNLNRNAIGNAGRYGDQFNYRGYAGQGGGYGDNRNFAYDRGYRHGRAFSDPNFLNYNTTPIKNTGIYVIPMPEKFFFDKIPLTKILLQHKEDLEKGDQLPDKSMKKIKLKTKHTSTQKPSTTTTDPSS